MLTDCRKALVTWAIPLAAEMAVVWIMYVPDAFTFGTSISITSPGTRNGTGTWVMVTVSAAPSELYRMLLAICWHWSVVWASGNVTTSLTTPSKG